MDGSFECLGSIQHLKNRFGSGYSVTIRVHNVATRRNDEDNDKIEKIIKFMVDTFPGAVLKEAHNNMTQFQLPLQGLKVSNIFSSIESKRNEFGIEDYSVSQTTLDEVFIHFAKKQTHIGRDTEC